MAYDLHQRLMYLTGLLDQLDDTQLWWMKVDLSRLFRNNKVTGLGAPYAHSYFWLLARMWMNGGYLQDDDHFLAGLMLMPVRTWKRTYKPVITPMLTRLPDDAFGAIWSQKRCVEIMIDAANKALAAKARTAKATAARWQQKPAKPAKRPSVTDNATQRAEPIRDAKPTDIPTESSSNPHKSKQDKRALPSQAESPFIPAPTADAAALPPRVNGHVERSAHGRSPSLKGGSLPAPSEALLKSKLVQAPLDDDDDEPVTRQGGDSLFGALEAAIRHGKAEED